jgi:hypothetical protein
MRTSPAAVHNIHRRGRRRPLDGILPSEARRTRLNSIFEGASGGSNAYRSAPVGASCGSGSGAFCTMDTPVATVGLVRTSDFYG